ncbi:MAG: exodeoxyribonuclease III [Deltaproteobacteria bacterium]|nr:MAG: exodeoxyribonuclease III [Deltaproteobacteria bacterium]
MRLASWNVNGYRAVLKKNFQDSLKEINADIIGLQETKLQEKQITEDMKKPYFYEDEVWAHASIKKGYSGVVGYSKEKALKTEQGFGIEEFDQEGRVVRLDYDDFILFNVYFPNGQMSDDRLDYKLRFYEKFFDYTDSLVKAGHSIIICGDYNTAHNEIDLKNPKANSKRSGFLPVERKWLDNIISRGYVDTFRYFYPDEIKYSWWSYRFKAREKNAGWRIDYFFVSKDLIESKRLKDAWILNDIYGSDHCPVGITLEV